MIFKLIRKDIKGTLTKKLSLKKGYTFKTTLSITLYNISITTSVFAKKLNSSFKKILGILTELDDGDEDGADVLLIKIETLRNIILYQYLSYIGKNKAKVYLLKLQEIENIVSTKKEKKVKTR